MTKMTIKEGTNQIAFTGILAEINLERATHSGNVECIRGDMSIKANGSVTKLKVFTNRLTKAGAENKTYKGLETIMNEYKSIAMTGSEDTADKVTGLGRLGEAKAYKTQKGTVIKPLEYSLNWIGRVEQKDIDAGNYEEQMMFSGDVFIESYERETASVDGEVEETGRTIANLVLGVYGGKAIPFKAFLEDPEAISYFEDIERGSSINVSCDLITKVVASTQPQQQSTGGFGRRSEQRGFTSVRREIIIVGAGEKYDDYDESFDETLGVEQMAYNPKAITQALAERQNEMDAAAKGVTTTQAQTTPQRGGFGARPTTTPTQRHIVEEEDDSLPF